MEANDIQIDDTDGDLFISPKTGDFVISPSDEEHIENLLLTDKGNLRQYPICGVGIRRYANAPFTIDDVNKVRKSITLEMTVDGYENISIDLSQGLPNTTINADRAD